MAEQPAEDEYPDISTMRFTLDLLEISRPERWWTATRLQLVDQADPDLEDGAQRHPDRDDIRWHLIGAMLSQISAKLDAGDYRDSAVLTNTAELDLTSDPSGYTLDEIRIIESWFTFGSYPKADGWQLASGDGRHRIWNVWRHRPDAQLPMRSHLLDFLDEIETEHLAATIREQATAGLAELPEVVRDRSPHYVHQLRLATQATVNTAPA